jgi:catechol 2,3-dioxygenase-like lactoylglutathione lyase family enzyme
MFSGISVLTVYVSDLERAKAFYTGMLGCTLAAELSPTACFLKLCEDAPWIYVESGYKPVEEPASVCRTGFCLELEGSILDLKAKLLARGVKVLQEEPGQLGENVWWFQFLDPDGNVLEVAGPK